VPLKPSWALVVPLTAVTLAGAACGGGDDGSGAERTATVRETAPARTIAPTEATLAQAAREYSALVDPLRARVRAINSQLQGAAADDDPSAAARGLNDYADLADDLRDGLLEIDFPPEARQQADELVSAVTKSGADARHAAAVVDDPSAVRIALAQWGSSLGEMSRRAAILRETLGLPPAPTA
jgi:hypothetical protein